jgi:hypothetical protein
MADDNPKTSGNLRKAEDSSSVSDDELKTPEVLPEELQEALKSLPSDERQMIQALILSSRVSSVSHSSPISKQITPAHIGEIIKNDDKADERKHQRSQSRQTTNRLGMGAILFLVIIVLTYAGLTKEKDLAEKIIIAGISGIGGVGAGYAIGKQKE